MTCCWVLFHRWQSEQRSKVRVCHRCNGVACFRSCTRGSASRSTSVWTVCCTKFTKTSAWQSVRDLSKRSRTALTVKSAGKDARKVSEQTFFELLSCCLWVEFVEASFCADAKLHKARVVSPSSCSFFTETLLGHFLLRHFGHFSHSCIKTSRNSVHQTMFSNILSETT